jgi:hypothetical protein
MEIHQAVWDVRSRLWDEIYGGVSHLGAVFSAHSCMA